MATPGVNANVQAVKWRDVNELLTLGLESDPYSMHSQVIQSIEIPAGFSSTTLTFQGAFAIQPVRAGSNVPAAYQNAGVLGTRNPVTGDNRYLEDLLEHPFLTINDESDLPVVLTVPAALPKIIALDDILPEGSAFRYLRLLGDGAEAPLKVIRIHSKEP